MPLASEFTLSLFPQYRSVIQMLTRTAVFQDIPEFHHISTTLLL